MLLFAQKRENKIFNIERVERIITENIDPDKYEKNNDDGIFDFDFNIEKYSEPSLRTNANNAQILNSDWAEMINN